MRAAVMFSLGTSVLLGTGALLVARVAMAPARPSVAQAHVAAPATVPVVVASAPLAYGDPVLAGKLTVARFPAGLAPQGAFSSIDQLVSGPADARVALASIAAREPILPAKISDSGSHNSVSAQIAPGMRAYAIKISDVAGVGGHALPGDRVDVVLAREPPARPGVAMGREMISDVVVQDVRLLGVNLNVDPSSTHAAATADPHTATLEVNLDDAQKLAVAAGVGSLSLALRRAGASEVVPARQVLVNDLASGAARSAARPVLVRSAPRHPSPDRTRSSVMIVQGDHDANVSVPVESRGGV